MRTYEHLVYEENGHRAIVKIVLTPHTVDCGDYKVERLKAHVALPERALRVFTVDEIEDIANFLDVIADEMEQ